MFRRRPCVRWCVSSCSNWLEWRPRKWPLSQTRTAHRHRTYIYCVWGGHRAQGTGHRAQGTGHRAQGTGHRAQGTGHRAQGTGHRAQGTGHRAQGTGHRAHPLFHWVHRQVLGETCNMQSDIGNLNQNNDHRCGRWFVTVCTRRMKDVWPINKKKKCCSIWKLVFWKGTAG